MKTNFFKSILLSFILGFLLIFSSFNVSLAYEIDSFTYDDYLKGIEEGWISEDMSYDELINVNKEAEDHFKLLEDSYDFTEVYNAKSFNDFDDFKVNPLIDDLSPVANVTFFQPGDVFIMNSSASAGLSGHAAMALSNDDFISIHGKGTNPIIFGRDEFKKFYGGRDIKVYRSNNYFWGTAAAEWADKTYRNHESDFTYSLILDLKNIKKTYCSKMIYHSYLHGNKDSVKFVTDRFKIIHPYLLDLYVKIGKHGEYDGYGK